MINKTATDKKRLDIFVDSLIGMPEDCLNPAAIAEWFSFLQWLTGLPKYDEIIESCFDLVEDIEKTDLPEKLRGFHYIYQDKIQILAQRNQPNNTICSTLLHELFEIVVEKFNQKKHFPYELTNDNVDLFAASVLMPEEAFFKFALKSDLDFQVILDKLPHICVLSILNRLHYVFQSYKTYYLGVVAENKKTRCDEDYPFNRNEFSNFEITNTTPSPKDRIAFNDKTLEEMLGKCLKIIMFQSDENKKAVTNEEGDFLIKATPLMYPKYGAIETIIMQIVAKKEYETLLKEELPKKSRKPYYTREYLSKNKEIKLIPYQWPGINKLPWHLKVLRKIWRKP